MKFRTEVANLINYQLDIVWDTSRYSISFTDDISLDLTKRLISSFFDIRTIEFDNSSIIFKGILKE